ncbi:MAG: hypothetical protein VKK98_07850 [Cyanobacteriota bacterium]|nr:hypothetical protein [Cyanobacteriota bacterium]
MTLLLLYAYSMGTGSFRKIERACYKDLVFLVLTGNQPPPPIFGPIPKDFDVIAEGFCEPAGPDGPQATQ